MLSFTDYFQFFCCGYVPLFLKNCPRFRAFFSLVYFFERTRLVASMRPPCLIYLSTSKRAPTLPLQQSPNGGWWGRWCDKKYADRLVSIGDAEFSRLQPGVSKAENIFLAPIQLPIISITYIQYKN